MIIWLYSHFKTIIIILGVDVARFLIRLANESHITDWDRVHLLGFSLGGHTVGVVGAKVQELSGSKIGRITGVHIVKLLIIEIFY